jgi:threonine dehydrogenase-like Zn-dependent dehydrogenase
MLGLHRANWGPLGAYLVGSYEEELHPHVERLLRKEPPVVVNVGASAGYYAVGLARRLPSAQVIAVDIDPYARTLCRELASINGVSRRLHTKRLATHSDLRRWLRRGALLIADCEGCEVELLDPVAVPELRAVDLIVELHDFVQPAASRTVLARFAQTHTAVVVASTVKSPSVRRYPALARLPEITWSELLNEHRPGPMSWAVLESRLIATHS